MEKTVRIGLIVPSSNTTMETEIPDMFRRRSAVAPETFTFHSSRARLQHVTREELWQMVCDSDRCALELSDARVDAVAYACLVALMSQRAGFHREAEERLGQVAAGNGAPVPVVSSAGALVDAIKALGATRVALIAPYLKPIAAQVVDYLRESGIDVVDHISLEVSSNVEVGRLDPLRLVDIAQTLDTSDAEALVLSACVQMPSLPAIQQAEDRLRLPVLSASTATAFGLLRALGLPTVVPDAGRLLAGAEAAELKRSATAIASSSL
jgi:maleate isomerase